MMIFEFKNAFQTLFLTSPEIMCNAHAKLCGLAWKIAGTTAMGDAGDNEYNNELI